MGGRTDAKKGSPKGKRAVGLGGDEAHDAFAIPFLSHSFYHPSRRSPLMPALPACSTPLEASKALLDQLIASPTDCALVRVACRATSCALALLLPRPRSTTVSLPL